MGGLEFTEDAALRLEALYLTRDMVAQRRATLEHLSLGEGEHVIDIGSGPGYLALEMAAIVGATGRVLGLDISADLVARAARRNARPWLAYRVGDATALAEADETFDVVACTQVAEYVAEVDAAIAEAFRVLKRGGRAVFVATDWDAVVWHSDYPERMAAVLTCWEAHCAHPRLPRSLPRRLRAAGFEVEGAGVFPILNLEWSAEAYSTGMTTIISEFVAGRGAMPREDVAAWQEEFPGLGRQGRYFFSSNRYIFRASKPGAR